MTMRARLQVPVLWADCDPAEIVFYPNYFRWFDAGTWNLFATIGWHPQKLLGRADCDGMPMLEAQARFVKASRFGETIEVESHILGWKGKVFRVGHKVYNAGELAVEGCETRIWVIIDETGKMRSRPIPEDICAHFGPSAEDS